MASIRSADVIVVGGGPAGSTAAWKLRAAGADVLVLDRASFPRPKLCAGWVTPRVLAALELDPGSYPASFLTFDALQLHWKFVSVRPATRQHSIRRYEFDDFLLRRAAAEVVRHQVRDVRRKNGDYLIDGEFRARFLVGAAGTACPVHRAFFSDLDPRNSLLQTATYEQEFPYDWDDPVCHLWFFDDGLPGYAWYVPKADGYINVGLGGMADQLKARQLRIRDLWQKFVERLGRRGLVRHEDYAPRGYSYYLRGGTATVRRDNAVIVGDAAGLATRDLCEGIGPAVESGLIAARAITADTDYTLDGIDSLSGSGLFSRLLERKFAGMH